MEINTVQAQTTAIAPLQTPEETGTTAEATNTTENRQSPAAMEAYRVNISAEARAEGEATASTNSEEAMETTTQETAEQVYTNTGDIA